MSYHVRTEAFDGPFDLLLHLVARRKVDIGAISIVEVADQYLAYIDQMEDLDLDIASDFVLVAAQLLEMKVASLIPQAEVTFGDELDDLAPEDAREILIARLITYKQFKNIAHALEARCESEGRMHPRNGGVEPEFLDLMPDYLEGVTLHGLAVICADLDSRRKTFLLEAEHIAAMPIPVELHVEAIHREIMARRHTTFDELVGDDPEPPLIVVTFLALLELYKRQVVSLRQDENFADIEVFLLDVPQNADETSENHPIEEVDIHE